MALTYCRLWVWRWKPKSKKQQWNFIMNLFVNYFNVSGYEYCFQKVGGLQALWFSHQLFVYRGHTMVTLLFWSRQVHDDSPQYMITLSPWYDKSTIPIQQHSWYLHNNPTKTNTAGSLTYKQGTKIGSRRVIMFLRAIYVWINTTLWANSSTARCYNKCSPSELEKERGNP